MTCSANGGSAAAQLQAFAEANEAERDGEEQRSETDVDQIHGSAPLAKLTLGLGL